MFLYFLLAALVFFLRVCVELDFLATLSTAVFEVLILFLFLVALPALAAFLMIVGSLFDVIFSLPEGTRMSTCVPATSFMPSDCLAIVI